MRAVAAEDKGRIGGTGVAPAHLSMVIAARLKEQRLAGNCDTEAPRGAMRRVNGLNESAARGNGDHCNVLGSPPGGDAVEFQSPTSDEGEALNFRPARPASAMRSTTRHPLQRKAALSFDGDRSLILISRQGASGSTFCEYPLPPPRGVIVFNSLRTVAAVNNLK